MADKPKLASPRQRLTRAAAEIRSSQEGLQERLRSDPLTRSVARTIIGPAVYGYPEENWEDIEARKEHADAALTLYKNDKAAIRTFKAFGLDSRNPYHWRRLLIVFAEIHFPATRSGRKKFWDRRRQHQLLADFAAEKLKGPKRTEAEICKLLRKHKYEAQKAGTLRNQLRLSRAS
jgi:hypothetical protein